MSRLKKYIETHWLFYALQGVASLAFGAFILFTPNTSVPSLVSLVGVALLCLGVIETFSLLYRKHYGGSLALSIVLAITEIAIALMLLFTKDYNMVWPLTLLSIYTLGRGIVQIFLAFTAMTDLTDRFMWVICGICASVIGVVILNSGNFAIQTTFIQFFGTYMMVYGLTNLFYGAHNRNELVRDKDEHKAKLLARQKAKAAKKTAKKAARKATKQAKQAKKA